MTWQAAEAISTGFGALCKERMAVIWMEILNETRQGIVLPSSLACPSAREKVPSTVSLRSWHVP